MCTVTFVKNQNHLVITSSRDENIHRPLSVAPRKITSDDFIGYAPIDPQGKGTWFIARDNGNVFVLLNGASKAHFPSPPYRKSRGLILMEIAAADHFHSKWNQIDLQDIEPFTVICYFLQELFVIRWDGREKQCTKLDEGQAHIWSSSTLYTKEIQKERENWFAAFLQNSKDLMSPKHLFDFHKNTRKEDSKNGLVIKREESNIRTKSITQYALSDQKFKLSHFDLITDKTNVLEDVINKVVVA